VQLALGLGVGVVPGKYAGLQRQYNDSIVDGKLS
jgi:hypothetical protein